MLIAKWVGHGKRVKRGMQGRKFSLYGMKWRLRERKVLTDYFIEQACLNEKGIFDAVMLSLRTDFGLSIQKKGKHPFRTGPLSTRGEELKRDMEMTDAERELMKEQAEKDKLAEYLSAMTGVTVEAEKIEAPVKTEKPSPPVDPVLTHVAKHLDDQAQKSEEFKMLETYLDGIKEN